MVTKVHAVRGATTVVADSAEAITAATGELLSEMLERNSLRSEDLISIVFTATPDLSAEFPAVAARALGMADVPLLCAQEIAVPGALGRCIRVLLHVNTDRERRELRHVYLNGAVDLRSDLASPNDEVDR